MHTTVQKVFVLINDINNILSPQVSQGNALKQFLEAIYCTVVKGKATVVTGKFSPLVLLLIMPAWIGAGKVE